MNSTASGDDFVAYCCLLALLLPFNVLGTVIFARIFGIYDMGRQWLRDSQATAREDE